VRQASIFALTRAPFLFPTLFAVIACGAEVAPAELPGLYVMNKGRAADSLWLRSDGRYVHQYMGPGHAAAVVDSGAWQVEHRDELRVTLSNFVERSLVETWPVDKPSLQPTTWFTYTRRASSGRPSLVVDDDLGWAFVRVAGLR
jgi:hypothetical protein